MPAVSSPPASRPSGNMPLTVPTPGSSGYDEDEAPLQSLELDHRPGPGQMHGAGRAMAQLSGVGISDVSSMPPPSGLSTQSSPMGLQLAGSTPPPVSIHPRTGMATSSGNFPAAGLNAFDRNDPAAHDFADFGDPPASFWLAPLYALRVYVRRTEIAKELHTRQEDFAMAKKAIEDALVTLGTRARRAAEPVSIYRGNLTAITAAEELLRTRDGQLSASMDAQSKRVTDVDAKISLLEEKLAGALTEQKRLEAELRAVQERLQRQKAQDGATRDALGASAGGGAGGRTRR
jgi:hypothetical protein